MISTTRIRAFAVEYSGAFHCLNSVNYLDITRLRVLPTADGSFERVFFAHEVMLFDGLKCFDEKSSCFLTRAGKKA